MKKVLIIFCYLSAFILFGQPQIIQTSFDEELAEEVLKHKGHVLGFFKEGDGTYNGEIQWNFPESVPYDWNIRLHFEREGEKRLMLDWENGHILREEFPHGHWKLAEIVFFHQDQTENTSCMVNVRCPEGNGLEMPIASVVHLYGPSGNFILGGSGALVNNTAEDRRPYILTAEHIFLNPTNDQFVSASELQNWVIEFNYETINCAGTWQNSPDYFFEVGAVLRARSTIVTNTQASDFALIELLNPLLPYDKGIYFAGWDRSTQAPQSGYTVHHPQSRRKKISFFTTPADSTSLFSAARAFWLVFWTPTQTNYSVTESGSSGCPLFSSDNYITGTLFGGFASCNNPQAEDYYGRFHYHWEKNGSTPNRQLKPWLDPLNLNVPRFNGNTLSNSTVFTREHLEPVYPNPLSAGEMITIPRSVEGEARIVLYDLQGNFISEIVGNYPKNCIFNMPQSLKPGAYFISVTDSQGHHVHKIQILP